MAWSVFGLQTPAHPFPASPPISLKPTLLPTTGLTHQTYGYNQAPSAPSHKQLPLGHLLGLQRYTQEQCAPCNQAWDELALVLEVDPGLTGQGRHGSWAASVPSSSRVSLSAEIPLSSLNFSSNEKGWPEGGSQQGSFLLSLRSVYNKTGNFIQVNSRQGNKTRRQISFIKWN